MAKKEESKEVAVITVSDFAVMQPDVDIKDIIECNLGGENISALDLERVTVPAGSSPGLWSIPTLGGMETNKELEGIIVYHELIRNFWASEGGGTPPDCYSTDTIKGIGDPGGLCEQCQNNEFGSHRNGSGKACSTKRTMFFIQKDTMLPMVVNAPPTSLKNARSYLMSLASHNVKAHHVVTRMTLEGDKSANKTAFYRIEFSMADRLAPAEAAKMDAYVAAIKPFLVGKLEEAATEQPFGDEPMKQAA
ncbi:MAG: hypothetical protein JEZ11_03780 [Desulfobacterales bacterium]|nr:hypothetical protein [Desulfobacterales bacterium]